MSNSAVCLARGASSRATRRSPALPLPASNTTARSATENWPSTATRRRSRRWPSPRAIGAVDHPSFRLCFDPGNLLYYAGERPEVALPKLAPLAVAMCIKDETGGNSPQRSVDVTPGDGDVDFPAIFQILMEHGFTG